MSSNAAASSYAKAVWILSEGSKQAELWLSSLNMAEKNLEAHPQLLQLISAPNLSNLERRDLLSRLVIGSDDPKLLGFFDLLMQNRRIDLLPEIIRLYQSRVHAEHNILGVRVISAKPLEASELDALQKRLEQQYPGKTIKFSLENDPAAVGGIALIINNRIVDGTIKGQLNALKDKLLAFNFAVESSK